MKIREICLYGILGALIFVLKVIMAPLPNIEPVSLLLMICAIVFKWKSLYVACVYVILEIAMYGFGIWSVGYLYVWFVLIAITIWISCLTSCTEPLLWAAVSGAYGVLTGALYIPLYIITGGLASAFSWWISGLPYDATHCIANFILCVVLFKPLLKVFKTIQN